MADHSKHAERMDLYYVERPDGSRHHWDGPMGAAKLAELYPGSPIGCETFWHEPCAADMVLIESGIPEAHWSTVRMMAQRFLNMSPDAGRPSDATRSAVSAFKSGYRA